jgi:hypothetical protein
MADKIIFMDTSVSIAKNILAELKKPEQTLRIKLDLIETFEEVALLRKSKRKKQVKLIF